MQFGEYDFFCTLERDAILPPYKGSTFRGAFGAALKQTVCALKRQDCPDCLLRSSCLYARVFEVQPADQSQRLAAAPHPYIIIPPQISERHLPGGSSFNFRLCLFGRFNESLPFFVYALRKMGQTGIGKGRAPFVLDRVAHHDQTLYNPDRQQLTVPQALPQLALASAPDGQHSIRCVLQTPLRLKHQGKLTRRLTFAILVRAALRRMAGLLNHYGDGEPQLDYRRLIHAAEEIASVQDNLQWHDWQRYSNRQQDSMQFGGLLGDISFANVPGEYLPILQFCSQVNLGKQTTFGLGQFALDGL